MNAQQPQPRINFIRNNSVEQKYVLPDIPKEELSLIAPQKKKHVREGIVNIDNVPAKHYLATELYSMFNTEEFSMQRLDRVEYGWDTEFNSPPSWMQEPYPWDWVIEVKRV